MRACRKNSNNLFRFSRNGFLKKYIYRTYFFDRRSKKQYKSNGGRYKSFEIWSTDDVEKHVERKKKNDTEKLTFYDFSVLYKDLKPIANNMGSIKEEGEKTNSVEESIGEVENGGKENGDHRRDDKTEIANEIKSKLRSKARFELDGKDEKQINVEGGFVNITGDQELGSEVEASSDSVDRINTTLVVKDDPRRIEKVHFENVYDYSDIFKEKEKRVEVKQYVGNIFQKFPKFKDNVKVIKDALLYLKFIEKGNMYLIKNIDKRTINPEPYDDLTQMKKKKGTKKDKIKLELASIYNNINKEKHMKKRICKECCIKADLYTKLLSRPLNNINNLHKNLKKFLHPFQYSLYLNTITNMYREGESKYSLKDVLFHIIELRKLITLTGKTYTGQMKYLRTCREIFAKLNETIEDINIILQSGRKWLDMYNSYVKKIRKIKYIDITKPSIAILGCPNVGKSSILNSLTNAKSPIADYSFTTKDFYLGHYSFSDENEIYTTQIMDLPGLLNRSEEKRNIMEQLTLSALKNLPSAVIYVFDPFKKKEHKHSSLKDQIDMRYYLRGLFPFRPWIDVITKYDLMEKDARSSDEDENMNNGEQKLKERIDIPKDIKEDALFISTEIEDSLLPLKEKIHEATYKLTDFINNQTTTVK